MKGATLLLRGVLIFCTLYINTTLANSTEDKLSKSRVVESKQYQFPFQDYQAFIKFMKASKFAKPAWSDSQLSASFPEDIYNACLDPSRIELSEVLYQSPNGITRGWTARPKESTRKLPVVVFNRGGFAKWGRIVAFELISLCRVASQGYMVVASDFRGVKGASGQQDITDLGYGDVNDSFYLVDAISQKYSDLDTDNLVVWGFSRGTSISAMMAARSDKIRLVILQGMVTNLVEDARRAEFDEHVYPLLVENYSELAKSKQDELLAGITPLHLIDDIKGTPAFLIVHGAEDKRTSAREALLYASELLSRDYHVDFHLYSDSGHSLSGDYAHYIEEVIEALGKYTPAK